MRKLTIGLLIATVAVTGCRGPETTRSVVTVTVVGDDNGDGVIMEDESGWNCQTMGNRVCSREA